MSDTECAQCGSDDVAWWPKTNDGQEARCMDCPVTQCRRCSDDLVGERASDTWTTQCPACERIETMGVWCEACTSAPQLAAIDSDGARLECECGKWAYVNIDRLQNTAPWTWQCDGRHGERRLSDHD